MIAIYIASIYIVDSFSYEINPKGRFQSDFKFTQAEIQRNFFCGDLNHTLARR